MAETVTETRAKLAEALAHDLRQLDLETAAVFVESQQREIERLRGPREPPHCPTCGCGLPQPQG